MKRIHLMSVHLHLAALYLKTLLIFVNIPLILELFHILYWITATDQ